MTETQQRYWLAHQLVCWDTDHCDTDKAHVVVRPTYSGEASVVMVYNDEHDYYDDETNVPVIIGRLSQLLLGEKRSFRERLAEVVKRKISSAVFINREDPSSAAGIYDARSAIREARGL